MAKRERKGRTWKGVVMGLRTEEASIYTANEGAKFPMWIRGAPGFVRVRITEIVPKSKKASKRKGTKA